jgi:hypothetical protein
MEVVLCVLECVSSKAKTFGEVRDSLIKNSIPEGLVIRDWVSAIFDEYIMASSVFH